LKCDYFKVNEWDSQVHRYIDGSPAQYNKTRFHSSLIDQTPDEPYFPTAPAKK